MSGECYSAKNTNIEVVSPRKENSVMDGLAAQENVDQLLEYESVISSAESKCTQLKGQIDRIKQLYNNQYEVTKTPPVSGDFAPKNRKTVLYNDKTNSIRVATPQKFRQNSQAIGTDTTGAALGTINNILVGITKPMETSLFFKQETERNFERPASSTKIQTDRYCHSQLHGVEDVKINSKSRQSLSFKSKTKCTVRRSRSKIATLVSSSNSKKLKKISLKIPIDKRHSKISDSHLAIPDIPAMNKNSRKILKQRFTLQNSNKQNYTARSKNECNGDLVEIYHNKAVKESKSSESDVTKKKIPKIEKPKTDINLIPPLTIANETDRINEPKVIRSCMSKNYTLPTISSRMKRVAKYYMNSFNIKTIPFCLSTSTSPSHNIGFNIQQVMSMVKNKQPFTKLSPTLAYNIGLAAGKNEEHSLPILLSSVTLKNLYSQCPLGKSMNYQQMQEVAKTVPQETIEEVEELDEPESPETQSIIITGPSGDVRIQNRKQTVWSTNANEKSCTCVAPKGLGFQQIVNKFNGLKPGINTSTIAQHKYKEPKIGCTNCGEEHNKYSQNFTPLQNKERKLKEVLGKMHDEFEHMTKTYDDLVRKTEEGTPSADTLNKLENLDKELNSKEEEIVMVMSLYKEVMALKQQVKTLKTRTSKESLCLKAQKMKPNPNNIITAGVLNKLLHQVQHYQTHYRKHY